MMYRVRPMHLNREIASAERYAALQAVLVYPASLRRQVIRQSLHGLRERSIAADLKISVTDVRAIKEAFVEFADDQITIDYAVPSNK